VGYKYIDAVSSVASWNAACTVKVKDVSLVHKAFLLQCSTVIVLSTVSK